MLEKVKEIIKKETQEDIFKIKLPKHIALTMNGIAEWSKKNKTTLEEANKRSFLILKSTIKTQIKLGIPILTFYLLPESIDRDSEAYEQTLNSIINLFTELSSSELINKNRVKISVLGKWYDLPGRVVEVIKKTIEETKDYDSFFVNFCINYNGQQEIVDACKLIAMNVKTGKVDPEMINKEMVKDNLYSSYFLPPDLIIRSGLKKTTSGLLLWDSPQAKIYFTNKYWPDFDKTEFMDAIKEYQKGE
jgi:tritrans,polycis-undecaprenyl-diphosphate synthase [geranylgeranyl-diphosphate specific]